MAKDSEPVFTISLEKGLADRHRLPIGHIISVLNETRQMLIETGREIAKERGIELSTPFDFGLEVLANKSGTAFRKGSVKASIAITTNIELGIEAARRVLDTVHELGTPKKPVKRVALLTPALSQAKIVNRLDKLAFIQEQGKSQAKFAVMIPKGLKTDDRHHRATATFGAVAVRRLAELREPVFSEGGVALNGKLVQLRDRTQVEDTTGKFWGELRRDNGERWRVQFDDKDQSAAVPLFRNQVILSGTAHYFQTRSPKLVVDKVVADESRSYVDAFDEIFGMYRSSHGNATLDSLLAARYGED